MEDDAVDDGKDDDGLEEEAVVVVVVSVFSGAEAVDAAGVEGDDSSSRDLPFLDLRVDDFFFLEEEWRFLLLRLGTRISSGSARSVSSRMPSAAWLATRRAISTARSIETSEGGREASISRSVCSPSTTSAWGAVSTFAESVGPSARTGCSNAGRGGVEAASSAATVDAESGAASAAGGSNSMLSSADFVVEPVTAIVLISLATALDSGVCCDEMGSF